MLRVVRGTRFINRPARLIRGCRIGRRVHGGHTRHQHRPNQRSPQSDLRPIQQAIGNQQRHDNQRYAIEPRPHIWR
nr:MAG TPA: hypothetical protein [Caudoviricetes sp.]